MSSVKNQTSSKLNRKGQTNIDGTQLISANQSDDDDDSLILAHTEDQQNHDDDESSDTDDNDEEHEQIAFEQPRVNTRSLYESLDYDVCENKLWEKDQKRKESKLSVKKSLSRWIIFLLIGMMTGTVGRPLSIFKVS